jgi:hypothetical protein
MPAEGTAGAQSVSSRAPSPVTGTSQPPAMDEQQEVVIPAIRAALQYSPADTSAEVYADEQHSAVMGISVGVYADGSLLPTLGCMPSEGTSSAQHATSRAPSPARGTSPPFITDAAIHTEQQGVVISASRAALQDSPAGTSADVYADEPLSAVMGICICIHTRYIHICRCSSPEQTSCTTVCVCFSAVCVAATRAHFYAFLKNVL